VLPYSFHLVDQPWIPCATRTDEPTRLLSLRDVFAQAPLLASVADPSPAVTISLYRFLLAILHRAFDGPRTVAEWQSAWDRNAWDQSRLDAYLSHWHDRFDLFDALHPFYQTPGIDARSKSQSPSSARSQHMAPNTATQLTQERASDRNRFLLFDHSPDDATLLPAEAARYLIAMHNFAVGGLISYAPGEPIANKNTRAAPLLGAAVVLVRGATLFQTLMLNWIRYNRDDDVPFPFGTDDDKPAWEREGGAQPVPRLPDGLVDLLTWQSRRILLIPDTSPEGTTCVRDAILMKGYQFAEGFEQWNAETMVAFSTRKSARGGPAVLPIKLDADRAVWRDSQALIQSAAGEHQRPKIMGWIDRLIEEGRILDEHTIVPLDIYGLIPDQANIRDWRQESLPLPLHLLDAQIPTTQQLLERLRQAITLAEDVGRLFNAEWVHIGTHERPQPTPMWTLCEHLLAGLGARQPKPDDCKTLARTFGAGPRYWAQLDAPFRTFIRQLVDPADVVEESGTTRYGVHALRTWSSTVERIAHSVFSAILNDLNSSARELYASATAEQRFNSLLAALLSPYREEPSVPTAVVATSTSLSQGASA
jgi:CRISPR system Cascade subunit CasA